MSATIERTVSILELLPEAKQRKVEKYAEQALADSPFKPLTKQQLMKNLRTSEKQIKAGKFQDARTALDEIGAKYGL